VSINEREKLYSVVFCNIGGIPLNQSCLTVFLLYQATIRNFEREKRRQKLGIISLLSFVLSALRRLGL
jgi:hypothetical protein